MRSWLLFLNYTLLLSLQRAHISHVVTLLVKYLVVPGWITLSGGASNCTQPPSSACVNSPTSFCYLLLERIYAWPHSPGISFLGVILTRSRWLAGFLSEGWDQALLFLCVSSPSYRHLVTNPNADAESCPQTMCFKGCQKENRSFALFNFKFFIHHFSPDHCVLFKKGFLTFRKHWKKLFGG
jgi:hypothetical protein